MNKKVPVMLLLFYAIINGRAMNFAFSKLESKGDKKLTKFSVNNSIKYCSYDIQG